MKIAAIVFDMDGLMLDTEPLYKAAWQQAARERVYMAMRSLACSDVSNASSATAFSRARDWTSSSSFLPIPRRWKAGWTAN
jgi:beta-phosphoglucomutase-like phosphatase (HAD superfamily)